VTTATMAIAAIPNRTRLAPFIIMDAPCQHPTFRRSVDDPDVL
jgi:hypothetical protein